MREMKDSGIAWIGEIPKEWEVKQLSSFFMEHKQKNKNLEEQNLLSLSYGRIIQKSIDTKEGLLPESFEGYNIIEPGDIVFRLTDLQNDKRSLRTGLCKEKGIITSAYITLRSKGKTDSNYYHNLFHSYDICKVFYGLGDGVRQGMNFSDLKKLLIIYPPLTEQQRIATFLDEKCKEIDDLIALQEEMITELQAYKQSVITEAVTKGLNPNVSMNDSGVEWIGEIPEHWEVKRLKFSCEFFGRIGFRGYKSEDLVDKEEGAITLSPSNMQNMGMSYTKCTYLSWEKYYESPEIMIAPSDVLVVKTGSTFGKCSFVDTLPQESTINPQIVVLKKHKDNPKFIAYSFQTPFAKSFIDTTVVGGTIPTISQEKMRNYYFIFPSLNEQKEIVDYLDTQCSHIDKLIALKRTKIEELQDYKKSVIYEYVTGKKEVPATV